MLFTFKSNFVVRFLFLIAYFILICLFSFQGMIFWSMMNGGKQPMLEITKDEVYQKVPTGYRPLLPNRAPPELQQLIKGKSLVWYFIFLSKLCVQKCEEKKSFFLPQKINKRKVLFFPFFLHLFEKCFCYWQCNAWLITLLWLESLDPSLKNDIKTFFGSSHQKKICSSDHILNNGYGVSKKKFYV